jgi:hypothetical protein
VAVLQNKTGERDALEHAAPSTWERLTPLVEVVGPKTPPPVHSKDSVAAWIRRLRKALSTHPFYLDIMRLDPTRPVASKVGTDPVLARMFAEARARQMQFVPVIAVGQTTVSHKQLVSDAVLEDGRGVGLRYRLLKVVPTGGKSHQDVLREHLDELGVDVVDADLLLDLEFLDEDREIDPDDLAAALRDMFEVGDWRCVVIIGTSIPKGMGCVKEGTVDTIPRREWDLWSALRERELPRVPAFGDYAIQHPEPPSDEIAGNVMRANIRYTTASQTVVARGRGPVTQSGNEQYEDLCRQLVARSEFSGGGYSWGDGVIDECARGLRDPGSQGMWRGAGTSHHLQFVTDQVRVLQP